MAFNVQLRSLASINGVVTITDAGIIYSYNENFLHELVGRALGKTNEVMVSLLNNEIFKAINGHQTFFY
jgi:hypothetical protein